MRKPVILLVEDDYRSYQALSVELTELGFTALAALLRVNSLLISESFASVVRARGKS